MILEIACNAMSICVSAGLTKSVIMTTIGLMNIVSVSMGDATLQMADEVAEALEKADGFRPSRSHVFRLAVAAMRKRMSDEGLISEDRASKRRAAK